MSEPEDLRATISTSITSKLVVTENLNQEAVLTTRDKIKVALHEMLPRYASTGQVAASLSLFIALLAAVLTADFRDRLGISGDAYAGAFALGTVVAGAWAAYELRRWINRPTLDEVADRIIEDAAVKR